MTKRSMSGSRKKVVPQRIPSFRLREVWRRWQPERPELLIRLVPQKRMTTNAIR